MSCMSESFVYDGQRKGRGKVTLGIHVLKSAYILLPDSHKVGVVCFASPVSKINSFNIEREMASD